MTAALPSAEVRPGWSRLHRDRGGSSSIEVLLLVPVILLFVLVVVAAGRIATTGTSIEGAARAAARGAALETDPARAQAVAASLVESSLSSGGVSCPNPAVITDTSQFARPAGVPATVTVTVTCRVPLGDLGVPGVGATRTITKTVSQPLDIYRERR